jgi:hypothetical protein
MEINLFDSAINFHCIVDSPYRDPSGIISTEIESTLLKSGKAWILNLTYYETGVVDPWIAINERFDGKHHNIGINARNNQQTVFQKNERQKVYGDVSIDYAIDHLLKDKSAKKWEAELTAMRDAAAGKI